MAGLPGSVLADGRDCVTVADRDSVEALVEDQRLDAARDAAMATLERCAHDPEARRLLARVQVAAGDPWGARKTLEDALPSDPADCATRAWLAWLDVEQLLWDDARTRLDAEGCPSSEEEQGRWRLLRALLASSMEDARLLRESLRGVGERRPLFPEDHALHRMLLQQHSPNLRLPLEATAAVDMGSTSNALAGSPIDTTSEERVGSAAIRPSGTLRTRLPEGPITPALEIRGEAQGVSADGARGRSYAETAIRLGAFLGRGRLRPMVAYAHEETWLDSSSRSRFAAADRAEVELTPARALSVLGGLGHRTFFADTWRTRREGDIAVVAGREIAGRPFVLATGLRLYDADRAVYDQMGATLSIGTDVPLGSGLSARLLTSGGLDLFPHSGGVDGLTAFGVEKQRRDVHLRASLGIWRRLSARVELGGVYEAARRWSTADASGAHYYPYVEHRFLVSVRVAAGGNPWRPAARARAGRVRLPYRALEASASLLDDQVRRMLRRSDDLTNDCGCQVR